VRQAHRLLVMICTSMYLIDFYLHICFDEVPSISNLPSLAACRSDATRLVICNRCPRDDVDFNLYPSPTHSISHTNVHTHYNTRVPHSRSLPIVKRTCAFEIPAVEIATQSSTTYDTLKLQSCRRILQQAHRWRTHCRLS